jgi:hypothetical protein
MLTGIINKNFKVIEVKQQRRINIYRIIPQFYQHSVTSVMEKKTGQ